MAMFYRSGTHTTTSR